LLRLGFQAVFPMHATGSALDLPQLSDVAGNLRERALLVSTGRM
jgi:hypothetical protein